MIVRSALMSLLTVAAWFCQTPARAAEPAYDPLTLPADAKVAKHDFTVHDDKRDRDIPIRVYLQASQKVESKLDAKLAAVVLFSHGLGGSRENNQYLANHWTARGYVCVFLQHPGSDENVWKN